MRGGEPDAQRLLQLAAREIAEAILPDLTGDARYRLQAVRRSQLTALMTLSEQQGTQEPVDPEALERRFQAALRRGDHDGDAALYESLVIIAEGRAKLVR